MQKQCTITGEAFEVTEEDLALLKKVSPVIGGKTLLIPPPTLCPAERMRRRLMFRNQQTLYRRKCDSSGKSIVSIYSPDKDQRVFSADEWWSDKWDALDSGRQFDFNRPFFDQFKELMRAVPHIAVLVTTSQNCDFTNQTYSCKNCYLSSAIKDCDSVQYSQNANKLTDCLDSSFSFRSELLYECSDCYDSYHCIEARHCNNCRDCFFSYDCIGCADCFGCVGLRQQKHHFFNERLSPEDYKQRLQSLNLHTHEGYQAARAQAAELVGRTEHESGFIRNCENVTGANVQNSRNCHECNDSLDLEDCRYSTWIFGCKDAMDCYGMGESQIAYDCVGIEEVQNVAFSFGTSNSSNCFYTDLCFSCKDCFGCVGLRKKQYCIFNKQYTKEEYEDLVPRIIAQMEKAGEWGEFFQPAVSAFAYNESKASELYPLSKEEAVKRNYAWKNDIDEAPKVEKIIPAEQLPGGIDEIPDDILNWALLCEKTKRPYRLTKLELDFYRNQRLPVPHLHQDVRVKERTQRRNA